eukprot:7737148-Pyramimonas_sp.AAC.1
MPSAWSRSGPASCSPGSPWFGSGPAHSSRRRFLSRAPTSSEPKGIAHHEQYSNAGASRRRGAR